MMKYTYDGILLSHFKKKETLLFATTWMDFVKSVSEMSQIEKDKYYMISFIFGV